MPPLTRSLLFLICFLFTNPAWAGFFSVGKPKAIGPFPTRTQNPLYLQSVAQPLDQAKTLPKGKFDFLLSTTFTNFFDNGGTPDIDIDFDMEIWRTALQASYGLTPHWTLSVELPFLTTSGGFLDAFIQDYHSKFGFPNGTRELVSNGSFTFKVDRNGSTLYQVNKKPFGLSDIPLSAKFNFFEETKTLPALAIKSTVKLPTGQASNGTGSGKADLATSLLIQKSIGRLHSYSQLGFAVLGGHDELGVITRGGTFLYGHAFEFNVTKNNSFVTQISGSTRYFKRAPFPELSSLAVDLTAGSVGDFPLKNDRSIRYHLAMTEDPVGSGASPSADFSILMGVGLRY